MSDEPIKKVYGNKSKTVAPGTKVNPDGNLTPMQAQAAARTKVLEPEQVFNVARFGMTMVEASAVLGMHETTFRRKLQQHEELSGAWVSGQANMHHQLRQAQYKTAVDDRNPTMLIWLGKQYLGQKDKDAIQPKITVDTKDTTISIRWDDELEKEYADVLAMDADTIDVTPIESSDEPEAAPASGAEHEAGADTEA
jgi:hypothetical protein